ncbi:MAG: histidine kinase, partial [Planctomycetes bacterium]|nr:histidine kinase [Planctomycetota bacterium]
MTSPKGVARARLRSFHELMQHRVQRILLVSSLYDSFIMSEEGHLQETLLSQFLALNLTHFPDILQASNSREALEALDERGSFDLVIASISAAGDNAAELARDIADAGHDMPVIGLAFTGRDLRDFTAHNDTSALDRIFLWQGDVRILLAMVKHVEDRLNVENDTGVRGVPAIIVVEDSIRFYSSFLPTIYSELFSHVHRLLSEDLNLSQKMMRMRARPKVLLCDNYDDAWELFERYQEQVLGVISDFEYPKGGELKERAGLDLCAQIHRIRPDARLVMQSSSPENQQLAEEIGASFLQKGSPLLLHQLQEVLTERF